MRRRQLLGQPLQRRRRHCDDVIPGQVGTAVRPCAGVDERVGSVDEGQVGVIDASAHVISQVVVAGEGHPGPLRITDAVGFSEEQGGLLPVRLVIVYSGERRAPVVHRVEEPVLQDDVSGVSRGPDVVRGRRAAGLLAADMRSRCEAAGDLASNDERHPHGGVDDPTHEADHREWAPTMESWAIVALPPASVRRPVQWVVHKRSSRSAPPHSLACATRFDRSTVWAGATNSPIFRPGTRRYNADASTYGSTGIGRNSSPWVYRSTGSNRRAKARTSAASASTVCPAAAVTARP